MLSTSSNIEKQNIPRYGVVMFLVLLVAMPKVDIIKLPFSQGYPGIRIEDLLLLFCLIIYLLLKIQKLTFSTTEFPGGRALIILLLYILSSGFLLKQLFDTPNFIILIRWIEYFFVYTVIFYMLKVRLRELELFFIIYVLLNFFVSILQIFHIVGGFRSYEYVESLISPFGITAGTWELSNTLNLIFFVLLVKLLSENRLKMVFFFLIFSLIFMIFIQKKMPFAVYLISTMWLFHKRKIIPFYFSVFIGLAIFIGVLFFSDLGSKFLLIFNKENLDYFVAILKDSVQSTEITHEYSFVTPGSENISRTLSFRLMLWSVALSNYFHSPLTILLGTGVGSAGLYVDGMWTRLLAELGILGLIFYFYWLSALVKKNEYALILIFIVVMNGLTLDTFSSSKIMGCLFLSLRYIELKFPRFDARYAMKKI